MDVFSVTGRCLECVWKIAGRWLNSVFELSKRCLQMSGRCFDGLWKVSIGLQVQSEPSKNFGSQIFWTQIIFGLIGPIFFSHPKYF